MSLITCSYTHIKICVVHIINTIFTCVLHAFVILQVLPIVECSTNRNTYEKKPSRYSQTYSIPSKNYIFSRTNYSPPKSRGQIRYPRTRMMTTMREGAILNKKHTTIKSIVSAQVAIMHPRCYYRCQVRS